MIDRVYLQLLAVFINYYLVIWSLIQYKRDGYEVKFILMITFLSIERFATLWRSIFHHLYNSGIKGMFISLLTHIIFCDYSIAMDTDDESVTFGLENLYKNGNFMIHNLNLLVIVQNLMIIKEDEYFNQNYPYYISLIYGIIHVCIIGYKQPLIGYFENDVMPITEKIKYFVQNSSKKIAFYLMISDLIYYNLWFIALFAPYLLFEGICFLKSKHDGYIFQTALQMQINSSEKVIQSKNDSGLFQLLSNSLQYIMLTILLILKLSLLLGSESYDILIYLTFALCFLQNLNSQICLIKYLTKGPFTFSEEIVIDFEQDSVEKKLNTLFNKIKSKYLSTHQDIIVNINNLQILMNDQFSLFFIKIMQQNIQYIKIKVIHKNHNIEISSFSYVSSIYGEQQRIIQFNEAMSDLQIQFCFKLIELYQKHNLDFQRKTLMLVFTIVDQIKMAFSILWKLSQFYENTYCIPVNFATLWNECFQQLQKNLLQMIVVEKQIQSYIPINIHQLLYDLYD